jgi:UDPglucose 6-dehydrogenase
MLKVAVLGLGVGYALSCALAEAGQEVIGIDSNPDVVRNPRRDKSVESLFEKAGERINSHLKLTTDHQAILDCDPIIICVSTGDEKKLELGHVEGATRQCLRILKAAGRHSTILVYSTLPYGSSNRIKEIFREEGVEIDRHVSYCYMPLMIAQGTTANDFVNPPFIAFGAYSKEIGQEMMNFYLDFIRQSTLFKRETPPHFVTDPEIAELGKLVANAFLSTKISFANMVARFCEENHLDGRRLLEIVGSDWRISGAMLNPGYSFGGACFPRDLKSLIHSFYESNVPCPILEATETVNLGRIEDPIRVISSNALGRTILVLGTAYKAGLKDTRGSPGLALIATLRERGYVASAYDPNFNSIEQLKEFLRNHSPEVVVVTTREPVFSSLKDRFESGKLRAVLDYADVVDPRGVPEGARVYKSGVGWVR